MESIAQITVASKAPSSLAPAAGLISRSYICPRRSETRTACPSSSARMSRKFSRADMRPSFNAAANFCRCRLLRSWGRRQVVGADHVRPPLSRKVANPEVTGPGFAHCHQRLCDGVLLIRIRPKMRAPAVGFNQPALVRLVNAICFSPGRHSIRSLCDRPPFPSNSKSGLRRGTKVTGSPIPSMAIYPRPAVKELYTPPNAVVARRITRPASATGAFATTTEECRETERGFVRSTSRGGSAGGTLVWIITLFTAFWAVGRAAAGPSDTAAVRWQCRDGPVRHGLQPPKRTPPASSSQPWSTSKSGPWPRVAVCRSSVDSSVDNWVAAGSDCQTVSNLTRCGSPSGACRTARFTTTSASLSGLDFHR